MGLLLIQKSPEPLGAFPGDYTFYQEATIDHTKVDGDLTDYPIYIDLSDLDKATDIFDTVRADGGDIRVTKADGTTQLPREVVSIDTGAKTGELHVKYTGTLSKDNDTIIRIWYNGTDTEPAADATYGSENTWNSDYVFVHHMNDASGGITDSTSNGNNGTENGDPVYEQGALFGNSILFDGDGDNFNLGFNTFADRTYSITALVKKTINATQGIMGQNGPSAGDPFTYFRFTSTGTFLIRHRNGDGTIYGVESDTALDDDKWYFLTITLDSGSAKIYVDGSEDGSGTIGAAASTSDNWGIGASSNRVTVNPFNGYIACIRFQINNTLSANWISTEYANQNSPSTFYGVGDQEPEVVAKPPIPQVISF